MPPKPYVQVACVCEKALLESDGVVSLIRVVDTYIMDAPSALPSGVGVAVNLTVVVMLKSGEAVGEHQVEIRLTGPDGISNALGSWAVILNGGEHGANVKIDVGIASNKYGLYWFDVMWGDEPLTRIPLRLKPRAEVTTAEAVAPTETMTHR